MNYAATIGMGLHMFLVVVVVVVVVVVTVNNMAMLCRLLLKH